MKKIVILCLISAVMLMTTGCLKKIEPGVVDLNAVEHNPEQSVNQIPEVSEKNDSAAKPEAVNKDSENDATDEPVATNPFIPETEDIQNEVPEKEEQQEPEEIQPEYTVVLDPGHGGRFTGAVYGNLVEKDTALKITLYAKEYLQKNYPQIEVKLTRETDADFDAELAKDLENRVQLGKEMGADVFVSFHLNASVGHNIRGAEVICPHREHVKTDSFLLGNCILDELAALGLKRRGIVTKNSNDTVDANGNPVEYYAINRHAANRDMIGIIVEHCFMDNEEDRLFIADDEALKRLAEADARGIAAYFGY